VTAMQKYLKRLKPTTVKPKKKLSPKIGDTKLLSTNSLEGEKIFTIFSGKFQENFSRISRKFPVEMTAYQIFFKFPFSIHRFCGKTCVLLK
jgi:hypothetical protein